MRKATKKPIEIEYLTFEDLLSKCSDTYSVMISDNLILKRKKRLETIFLIPTLEGKMAMTKNDVLIVGVNGEVYPCKVEIFIKTYTTKK